METERDEIIAAIGRKIKNAEAKEDQALVQSMQLLLAFYHKLLAEYYARRGGITSHHPTLDTQFEEVQTDLELEKMSSKVAEVFLLLKSNFGMLVENDVLRSELDLVDEENWKQIIEQRISRLRAILRENGSPYAVKNKPTRGYKLVHITSR